MAITVEETIEGTAIDGGDITLTFTVLQENDVVLIVTGVPRLITVGPQPGEGYTDIGNSDDPAGGAGPARLNAAWKRQGATPDSSVIVDGSANAADAIAAIGIVLRGVDTTTALDATSTSVGADSGAPDGASITTVTNDAMVITAFASKINDAAVTAPTGYGNKAEATAADTRNMTVGIATKIVATAGAEDPGAWADIDSNAWATWTIAFRPAAAGAAATYPGCVGGLGGEY